MVAMILIMRLYDDIYIDLNTDDMIMIEIIMMIIY